jgi:DNA-binding winged helix-turn-helix (wHTH) protein
MKSPALITRVIRFGVFEFNPQTGELRRHGLKVKLEPQASKILSLPLEHPGKICAREELQRQLWQDNTFVDFEGSLYKGIHTLRGSLGDSAVAPRYVETATGRGYRFIPIPQEASKPRVGPARWKYAWAFRSLRDAGAVLAFSSDWNVAEMEPLIGIYTALTRKGLDGKPEGGWVPAQTIDLDTAIRAYTINGAFANFAEQNRGSITPGKYADLVMLSDDLFKIPAEKIKDTDIVWTMVGGKTVWSKQ